ncbi:hypothetical protein HYT53_02515 [Candidatus Woesearchaeota archaeon]|nr:hypothetical protein [Candidatus Woesearchaeota archaeon]
MNEQADYYLKKDDYTFIFKDIFDIINDKHLELRKKLLTGEISKSKYDEEYSKGIDIIGKASKSKNTKKEFINEYLKFKFPEKIAKEQWKHEREHYNKIKQKGNKAEIRIIYLIIRENLQKVGLIPVTLDWSFDSLEGWSLDKFREHSLELLDVKSLSDMDIKQKEVLSNQP